MKGEISMFDKGSKSRFHMMLRQPVLLLSIILVIVSLIIFIIFPLFNVLRLSLTGVEGGFSLSRFQKILGNQSYIKTFGNSIKLGVIVAIISTLMGYIFAYAVTRTEVKGKKFFQAVNMGHVGGRFTVE